MKYKRTRTGITRQDLVQDRAFWRDLLARRTSLRVCRRIARGVTGTVGSRSSATPRGSPCTGRRSRLRKWACSSAAPALPARLSSRWLIAPVRRLSLCSGRSSVRTWQWNGALPTWDDRYRGDPGRPAALERQCGGTAYCMDASGWRRVVELFRVPGRRSGGHQYLSREAGEVCFCKGRVRRAARLSHEADPTQYLGWITFPKYAAPLQAAYR